MARGVRFCRTFLRNVRVRKQTDMRESLAFRVQFSHARVFRVQFSHARVFRVQFSHVRVFSDSRNVQKSVTQIIYLWPLS